MTIKELSFYDEKQILTLYASVGRTNYTAHPEMLKAAFAHSLLVLAAYDGETLAGILRAVGDGFSVVFIQDLLVRPDYQRKGIGAQHVQTLQERFSNVYQIELLADDTPELNAFYHSIGFQKAEEMGCCAFLRVKT